MSKMVLPKIVKLGRSPAGKRTFTDAKLNAWSVDDAQYNQLSERQQRMVIAADIVARLDARKYIAKQGHYLDLSWEKKCEIDAAIDRARTGGLDARTVVREKLPTCGVCARGATFLAVLDRRNSLNIMFANDLTRPFFQSDYLTGEGPFTYDQQLLMEACFEKWVLWNPKMCSPRRRLRSLMMNIISNNGKFVGHLGFETISRTSGDMVRFDPLKVKW
jgi:hypothetical protein